MSRPIETREVPWIWFVAGSAPTTNLRIEASILAMLATAIRVVGWDWTPPLEWLGFLSVWGGLDWAQYRTKRTTDDAYVAANQPPAVTSTSTLTQPDGTVSATVTTQAPVEGA